MKFLLCALCFFASTAIADSVQVDVAKEAGNRYVFNMHFIANAPASRVIELITDYANLTQLNPLIKSSQLLSSPSKGIDRVELITEGCMLFFCKKIRRVEDVNVKHDVAITSVIVPALSDFKSGNTTWTFMPAGDSTSVTYKASMVPDFWLPPFVGPYALKKQLHSQLQYTANKINSILVTHE